MITDKKVEQEINVQARKYLLENEVPHTEMYKASKDFESGALWAIENYKKFLKEPKSELFEVPF